MPYLALPPELPPPIVAAAEVAGNSQLTHVLDSASSSPGGVQDSIPRPATSQPTSQLAQAVALKNYQRPTNRGSSAALLGNTAAQGYFSSDRPFSSKAIPNGAQDNPGIPSTSVSDSPVAKNKSLDPTGDRTPDRQTVYSLSGASGSRSKVAEPAVIQGLNQGLIFDALFSSFQAFQGLSAADLKRLSKPFSSHLAQITPAPTLPGITPAPGGLLTPNDLNSPTQVLPGLPGIANPIPEIPIPNIGNPATTPPTVTPISILEVNADRQEYDERQQVFTAEGNVTMRFRGGLLDANRIQVNLVNRIAVAEGNVALTRGQQVLRGERFEYNLGQGSGTVTAARGDIFLPTTGIDLTLPAATDNTTTGTFVRPQSDRLTVQQPQEAVASPGGIIFSAGAGANSRSLGSQPKGQIRRLRFQAERVDFTPEGWVAKNIQITNDPFSPPELVLRAERATLTRLSPLEDEVRLTRPRLVLDQRVALPVFFSRQVISRAEQEPGLFRFAYDDLDRGGVYVEGVFNIINSPTVQFTLFPQIFLQRMIVGSQLGETPVGGTPTADSGGVGDPNNYGLRATLEVQLGPTTEFRSTAAFLTVDPSQFTDRVRANALLRQEIPLSFGTHNLAFLAAYRDRLFNGSLGFQTVQRSFGALFYSPNITLGTTGFVLNYQAGFQYVTADTDQERLLKPIRENNRVSLGRFQTTAGLNRNFTLWQGKPLPATATEGLRYSPNVLTPSIFVTTGLRGVFSNYTDGSIQQGVIGSVGLGAQFGRFARNLLDYTFVGVTYNQYVGGGQSPFLFDRQVDDQVIILTAVQQLYGPLRLGYQTQVNVLSRDPISTNYFLEYSRRTHGVTILYNPVLQLGSISIRISDFNWGGTAQPFEGSGVTPVEGGVIRRQL